MIEVRPAGDGRRRPLLVLIEHRGGAIQVRASRRDVLNPWRLERLADVALYRGDDWQEDVLYPALERGGIQVVRIAEGGAR